MENFNIEEIINWSDEQCENFDKEGGIPTIQVRNVVNKWNALSLDYNKIYNDYRALVNILSQGKMIGYTITCPKCSVSYNIKPDELNYNIDITCQDCGEHYVQNKNITGIWVKVDNDE